MNIPKEAKDKAFDGGWKPFETKNYLPNWQSIALDPTFWQALGPALEIHLPPEEQHTALYWFIQAHRFYDLILQGQSTEEFWKELFSR
jgi:hypothetical protein